MHLETWAKNVLLTGSLREDIIVKVNRGAGGVKI